MGVATAHASGAGRGGAPKLEFQERRRTACGESRPPGQKERPREGAGEQTGPPNRPPRPALPRQAPPLHFQQRPTVSATRESELTQEGEAFGPVPEREAHRAEAAAGAERRPAPLRTQVLSAPASREVDLLYCARTAL